MKYIYVLLLILLLFNSCNKNKEPYLISYSARQTSDSTWVYDAMIVRVGDSRIYGRSTFEFNISDKYEGDNIIEAHKKMLEWYFNTKIEG